MVFIKIKDEFLYTNLMAIITIALGSSFQLGYNSGLAHTTIFGHILIDPDKNPEGTTFYLIAAGVFHTGQAIGNNKTKFLADNLGCRKALLVNNLFIFFAAICFGLAKFVASYELFVLGTFLTGMNAGFNSRLAPMYLKSICSEQLRKYVKYDIKCVYFRVLVPGFRLLAWFLSWKSMLGTPETWHILFSIAAGPAFIQVIVLLFCSEVTVENEYDLNRNKTVEEV